MTNNTWHWKEVHEISVPQELKEENEESWNQDIFRNTEWKFWAR